MDAFLGMLPTLGGSASAIDLQAELEAVLEAELEHTAYLEDLLGAVSAEDSDHSEDDSTTNPQDDSTEEMIQVGKAPPPTSKAVTLPVEVWERILINVEPYCMHKMSQISQQHLAITKSPFFRARYFYARHMPCQAIYHASCRPKLFTQEVLQALLSLGAVMSRYFCQSVLQRHLSMGKPRGNLRWSTSLTTSVVVALLNEGLRLYGDDLKLGSSDGTDIKLWADQLSRHSALTDSIREKFVKGRFAVFSSDDACFHPAYTPCTPIANAIAYHPELLQILLDNGYEFQQGERDKIVVCICEKYDSDEEGLYARLDSLLVQFPDWVMKTQARNMVDYITMPNSTSYAPVPATEAGRTLLAENDGIGPIKATLKVMKRLFDEGRGFLDLGNAVKDHVKACCKTSSRPKKESAPQLRTLAHLFPKSVEEYKVQIATTFVLHFEQEFKDASTAGTSRGMEMLFNLIDELELTKHQWLTLVLDEHIVSEKILAAAIKRGYFGALDNLDEDDKASLIAGLVSGCISSPMSGHHLYAIEAAAKDLFANEKSTAKKNRKVTFTVAAAIEEALMQWQFNLDTLKPDRRIAVEHKLRTPIAWLTKGQYTVTSNSFHMPGYITHQDPYQLLPPGVRPHHGNFNEMIDLNFAFPQAELAELDEEVITSNSTSKSSSRTVVQIEKENVGWKHLGHINQLEAMANDSGVMIIDTDEQESPEQAKGVEDSAEGEEDCVIVGQSTTARKSLATGKIGSLLTFVKKVVRIQCAACNRSAAMDHTCNYQATYHRQAKELASVLPLFLPADSPAMRDIVLAHALVNGNVNVIKDLMRGDYHEEGAIGEADEEVKPLNRSTGKTRLGQPEKPVLPTLAHWRIMQALERKPVDAFVERIMQGAPFKRGYIQSSDATRSKEKDLDERRKWYKETGHKDDRPMTSLFREKQRLEAIDKAAKKKQVASRRKSKAKSKSRSLESDDDDDDEKIDASATTSLQAVGSQEVTSARTHLRRSATRKPIRYNESASLSSDEDDDMSDVEEEDEDPDELRVAEMLGTTPSRTTKKAKAQALSDGDLFGHGSDLSDFSSDVEEQKRRPKSNKDESETDSDDDDDSRAIGVYGFDDDETPMVTLETEYSVQNMPLQTLYRRSKSLKLWLEHLHLLLWFERRKERITKEKAQKVRQGGRPNERTSKSKFSIGLSDFVKRIEAKETMMQDALQPALKERRQALVQKKRNASKGSQKADAGKQSGVADKAKKGTKRQSTKDQSQAPKKRRRIVLSEVVIDAPAASSSRKRRQTTKRHSDGAEAAAETSE